MSGRSVEMVLLLEALERARAENRRARRAADRAKRRGLPREPTAERVRRAIEDLRIAKKRLQDFEQLNRKL